MLPIPARIKRPLKQARHELRNAYIRRFFAFTPADFVAELRRLGVRQGDILCVHSAFDQFLGFRGNVGDALTALKEAVGSEGGLMMPTMPFGGSAVDYVRATPVTNVARVPSMMGLLTELLRRTPGAVRTISPTHPVALWGAKGVQLAGEDWKARTPCGRGTAYHRLLEADGKIAMLGTSLEALTFYHCVEEIIEPLMPFSPFTAEEFDLKTQDKSGRIYESRFRLYDREHGSRRRMWPMIPELKRLGLWKEAKVGRLEIILLRAADVVTACESMAKKGEFCYPGGHR
jgi:aminoglycoside 3-N-acetyltransferase